ncbi:MAG: GlmU family protein [Bacteroidales bacterium]
MMNIILADAGNHTQMKPLTWTRPVGDIRTGILTTKERWEKLFDRECYFLTEHYLQEKFPLKTADQNLIINAGILPDEAFVQAIKNLKHGTLVKNGEILACVAGNEDVEKFPGIQLEKKEYPGNITMINHPWDVFTHAGNMINFDYKLLTQNKTTASISNTNIIIGEHPVFVEPGARVEASVLNTTNGPIYIGKDAEVMESCSVRGPFAMNEYAVLKMGAKVYGPTMLGPWVKAGGELNNVVFQSYSNKAHDGFLGNAVIGEWCNIGADTNNSNLKNNYAEVKMWDYNAERFVKTGLQFCGLVMGDHSKCGINTMFNTGTIIGVSCNLFGPGFPRNFIPSFSWGGAGGYTEYKLNKALQVAEIVMNRRGLILSGIEKRMLEFIYKHTQHYRKY